MSEAQAADADPEEVIITTGGDGRVYHTNPECHYLALSGPQKRVRRDQIEPFRAECAWCAEEVPAPEDMNMTPYHAALDWEPEVADPDEMVYVSPALVGVSRESTYHYDPDCSALKRAAGVVTQRAGDLYQPSVCGHCRDAREVGADE
jgi:hypothetical protein